MAMLAGGPGGAKADFNMNPLVDVRLVPLIVFRMITRLLPRGLEALLPQSPANRIAAPQDDAVVIEVMRDHTCRVNRQPAKETDLTAKSAGIFESRADKTVFVKSTTRMWSIATWPRPSTTQRGLASTALVS